MASARVSTVTAKFATAGLLKGLATDRIRNIAMPQSSSDYPQQAVKSADAANAAGTSAASWPWQ